VRLSQRECNPVISDPPRKLGLGALRLAFWERPRTLLIGVVMTMAPVFQTVVFLLVFSPLLRELDHAKIRATGKLAQGEVLRVEGVGGLTINNVEPKRVFFRYQDAGTEREGSMMTLSVSEVGQWKKGQPVTVRYVGDQATLADLEPVELPFPLALFSVMAVAMSTLIGLPFLAYGVVGARRKYLLLKHGVARQGKLVSFESLTSLASWSPSGRFLATYTYADSAGRDVFGSAPSRDLTLLNGKKKGDEIEILVLPNDEQRSTILDSSTQRVLQRA
jgi:hypothetical protein